MRPSESIVSGWTVRALPALSAGAVLVLSLATRLTAGSGMAQSTPGLPAGPVRAFVTIQPQAFFVERIGGDRVQVEVLVGPGQCAETFEATPRQLARMAGARLYYAVGMPMEETLVPRLRGNFPGLVVVDTQEGIARRDLDGDWVPGPEEAEAETDHGTGVRSAGVEGHAPGAHTHSHTGADPHTWLDPALAQVIARNITRGLVEVDPADSALFRANLRSLEADLDRVDAEVREILAPVRGREMLVYHPYYGYFARAYGLRQAAIEVGGFRSGSKYLAGIIDRARENGIHAIFVQEGVALSAAETVAKEIGGRVIVLDPLSRDYLVNLPEMARRVRQGLLVE
jgi:zinc transport system substrate-binding protein